MRWELLLQLRDMVYSPNKYRETEGIKVRRLGYDLSQARLEQEALNLGISQSVNDMTQAEKGMLRYSAIMTQVTQVQGDMSRTLESPANQLRILQAQLAMAARAIGNIFIPALNATLPYIIAVVQGIREIANAIANIFGFELTEIDYSGITDTSLGVDDLTSGLEDASSAAQELQSYVLGFDELNVLSQNSSSAIGDSVGLGSGFDFELTEYDFLGDAVSTRVDEIMDVLDKDIRWVKDNLEEIGEMVSGIAIGIGSWFSVSMLSNSIKNLTGKTFGLTVLAGLTLIVTSLAWSWGEGKDLIDEGLTANNLVDFLKNTLIGGAGAMILLMGTAIPAGAAFGIGAGLSLIITIISTHLAWEAKLDEDFYSTELGKIVEEYNKSAESMGVDARENFDIISEYNLLLGEGIIDPNMLMDLDLANILLSDIFELNNIENRTPDQIQEMITKINELNSLSFGEIISEWDSQTGAITQTREEIELLINEAMKLAEVNALSDILEESWRIYYETQVDQEIVQRRINELTGEYIGLNEEGIEQFQALPIGGISGVGVDYFASPELSESVNALEEVKEGIDIQEELYEDLSVVSEGAQKTAEVAREGLEALGIYLPEFALQFDGDSTSLASQAEELEKSWGEDWGSIVDTVEWVSDSGLSNVDMQSVVNDLVKETAPTEQQLEVLKKRYVDMGEGVPKWISDGLNDIQALKELDSNLSGLGDNSVKRVSAAMKLSSESEEAREDITAVHASFEKFMRDAFGFTSSSESKTYFDIGKHVIQSFWDGLKSTWSELTRWWNTNINPSTSEYGKAANELFVAAGVANPLLNFYASGGFPSTGELFVAREAGPEMVGSIGGKTAVANNDQIVSGIASGVYKAVVAAMSQQESGEIVVNVKTELDGQVVYQNQEKVKRERGTSPGLGVFAR